MNSEEQTAPPPGVAVVTTPEGVQPSNSHTGSQPQPQRRARNRKRNRMRNRNRNRKRNHNRPHPPRSTTVTTPEDRPPVTEGTQLHQARQNHSTYDRDLHHRGKGGTGYGYRRDVLQNPDELRGDQLPPNVLPSYEQVLKRARAPHAEISPPPLAQKSYEFSVVIDGHQPGHVDIQLGDSMEQAQQALQDKYGPRAEITFHFIVPDFSPQDPQHRYTESDPESQT